MKPAKWAWQLLGLLSCLASAGWVSAADRPVITAIRLESTNIVVEAHMPAGLRKATLESRTRLAIGAWVPRLVRRLNGVGGSVTLRLPRARGMEILRLRADATEVFPSSFYEGSNSFTGLPSGAAGPGIPGPWDFLYLPTDTPGAGDREVVESDIWKISGETLFFFNQYRGLQIVDITQPDAPRLQGSLNLPAVGEQMYLLGGVHAVLLTRQCGAATSESEVLIVNVTGGQPQVITNLTVPGSILESRMVGTALYVASETYRPVDSNDPAFASTWEWGTTVAAYDLADPDAPVTRPTLWFAGVGNVVSATDRFLFVALRDGVNWWQSIVRLIDISSPDGTMRSLGSIVPQGQVPDKFKMNVADDVFTVISEVWSDQQQWVSTLETFSLAQPETPEKLGHLEIKPGERLFATRFDGPRVYVVTFQRIDPLFVVDLSDPRAPKIAGEVEVPGWSTYIHPLGERLVTIGLDNTAGFRVAVSLFDVRDPARPTLLSRVPVGENYSWSEATSDEKAFSVLPEIGLLLVPYQGYSTNGYSARVQLIDLTETNLVARGAIDHRMQPRRATTHRDRVLSLSGWELLTVDVANRDLPALTHELELAWRVDHVFLQGDYLLELATDTSWDNRFGPTLRVSLGAMPDRVLQRLELTNVPVLGAAAQGQFLYLLQGKPEWSWPAVPRDGTTPPASETNLTLSVIDLASLPQVRLAGQTQVATEPLGLGSDWQALWPKPGLVVWSGGTSAYWAWWDWGVPLAGDAVRVAPGGFWRPWYWGAAGGRLIAFNVGNALAPQFLSDLNLASNTWWNFSPAFPVNGLVFLSHETSEFLEGVVPPSYVPPIPSITFVPTTGEYVTN
jgi:hypothetical protein